MADLPRLDEHETTVRASTEDVWAALLAQVDAAGARGGAAAYARAVGCVPAQASGPRPLDVGSTIPGFAVVAADRPSLLRMEGRHRFSTYALVFHVDDGPDAVRLRAESLATFPRLAGRAYRLLVVGTGAHVFGVRRLLAGISRRATAAQL